MKKLMVWAALAAMLAMALAGTCAESQVRSLDANSKDAAADLKAFEAGAPGLNAFASILEQEHAAGRVMPGEDASDLGNYIGALYYNDDVFAMACVLYNESGTLLVASEAAPFLNAGIGLDDLVKQSTLALVDARTVGSYEAPGYLLHDPLMACFPYEQSQIVVLVYGDSPFASEFVPPALDVTNGIAAGFDEGMRLVSFGFLSKDERGYGISGMNDSPLPGSPVLLVPM